MRVMYPGLENWLRRITMSQSKSIIFTGLFCLLFCATELHALGPNKSNPEKQKAAFSLNGIVKSLDGTINGIGKSLDGAMNGFGKSLDGTMNGIGKSLDGTMNGLGKSLDGVMNGLGKSLDGTMNGLGEFLDGAGEFAEEFAEVALVAGVIYLYIIADVGYYHYGSGHHHGYGHHYHR